MQIIRDRFRRETPDANHVHLTAIWNDYEPRLMALDETAPEYRELADEFNERLIALRKLKLKHAPPALYREPEESARSYLDRCYRVWIQTEKDILCRTQSSIRNRKRN